MAADDVGWFPDGVPCRLDTAAGPIDAVVRAGDDDEHRWRLVAGDRTIGCDDLDGAVLALPEVTRAIWELARGFDRRGGARGGARLRIEGAPDHARADRVWWTCTIAIDAQAWTGAPRDGLDAAILDAAERARAHGDLVACLTCQWSAFEPGTGWGHLYCFARCGEAYLWLAGSRDVRDYKHRIWGLPAAAGPEAQPRAPQRPGRGMAGTDELHACAAFRRAPRGVGYK